MLSGQATSDFERCRKYLEAALEHAGGTHTIDDVRAGIEDGRLQLWPGVHSAIVTELLQHPRQRILHFFLAGGSLEELQAMTPPILDWGRTQGCSRAALFGRPGWSRSFLTKEGWRPTAVVMEKVL